MFDTASVYGMLAVTVGHRTNSGQKYVICLGINEQVNPGSKIWLPNVRSILKPYWEPRHNGCNHTPCTCTTAIDVQKGSQKGMSPFISVLSCVSYSFDVSQFLIVLKEEGEVLV